MVLAYLFVASPPRSRGSAAAAGGRDVHGTCFRHQRAPARFSSSTVTLGHGVGMSSTAHMAMRCMARRSTRSLHYYPARRRAAPVSKIACFSRQAQDAEALVRGSVHSPDVRGQASVAAGRSRSDGARAHLDGNTSPQRLTAPLTFTAQGRSVDAHASYRGRSRSTSSTKLRASTSLARAVSVRRRPVGDALDLGVRALKPAVAARRTRSHRQVAAPFDVYSDTRSQMYLGLERVSRGDCGCRPDEGKCSSTRHDCDDLLLVDLWCKTSRAGLTAPRVRTSSPSRPVRRHVAVPHLGPVPVTAQSVVKALKLNGRSRRDDGANAAVESPNSTRHASRPCGDRHEARAALGLRSTWFNVACCRRRSEPEHAGRIRSAVTLAHDPRLTGVTLEQRTTGALGSGRAVSRHVKLTQKPTITTDYGSSRRRGRRLRPDQVAPWSR